MNRRLFRSPDDRILAGVAGGMAETYDVDPALARVGWALLILLTGGVFLVLYIVMALVVPLRPSGVAVWATADGAPGPTGEPGPGGAPVGPPSGWNQPGYGSHYRRRDGSGALIIGLILIVVGAWFLARQFIPALNTGLIWPFVVIGGGLLLIVFAFGRGRGQQ